MLKQIDIIEYDNTYYILGYNINNQLQYLIKEPVQTTINLESIYLCKVNKVNYGNNTAFVNIGSTGLCGFINLNKQIKIQDGSIIPLQVRHFGDDGKQIKLDHRINLIGKYVVVRGEKQHLFYCDNVLKESLSQIASINTKYGVVFRTNIPLSIDISLVKCELNKLCNKLDQINSRLSITSTLDCVDNGLSFYLKFIRDNLLTKDCIIATDKWDIQTITYQNNYDIDIDLLVQQQNLSDIKTDNYTLEIHKLSGINLIDINSSNANLSFYKINYLAIDEIVKQIKFRDLTGIILLDLIKNMSESQQQTIINKLTQLLMDDFRNSKILGFTNAGLCEIIRMR